MELKNDELKQELRKVARIYKNNPSSSNRERLLARRQAVQDNNTHHSPAKTRHPERHLKFAGYPDFNSSYHDHLSTGEHIIASSTSVGKSALLMNLMLKAFEHDSNLYVDVFTLEDGTEQYLERCLSNLANVPLSALTDPYHNLNDDEKARVHEKIDYLRARHLHIYDKMQHLDDIKHTISHHATKVPDNQYLAIVDSTNLIELSGREDRLPRYQQAKIMHQNFRELAHECQVPLFVAEHLKVGKDDSNDWRDLQDDMVGVRKEASSVIFLTRTQAGSPIREVRFLKNTHGELGDFQMNFDTTKMKMDEIH